MGEQKKEPKETNQRRLTMFKKLAIVFGVAIAIAAIVICAVPLKTVSYAASVPYEDTETYYVQEAYTVQEPYTRIETYIEREPYNKPVPIDYIVSDTGIYNWFWTTGSDVWVTIKNADVKSGYFYVTFYLTIKGGATTTKLASQYIAIGETKQVKTTYSGGYVASFTYSIIPPTKTVSDFRDVNKTREVTEYRDITTYRSVPKQRTMTKTRSETRYKEVSLLDYLLHY